MLGTQPLLALFSRLEAQPWRSPRVSHEYCRVGNRSYCYGLVEGNGPTVVLLHGWALAHGAYGAACQAIATQGYRVIAPDLPGFGQSSDPAIFGLGFSSYAALVSEFLENCEDIGGPVHLVGHSFGGAVAAQVAHDSPELVSSVVLVSSVSGVTWLRSAGAERLLSERPLWDWAVHLVSEFPTGHFPRAALGVLRDLSHNVVWHPASLGILAGMIRNGDLRTELTKVRERGLPVAVLWPGGDRVVTRACFDDQCSALGIEGRVVSGNHGWPLSEPGSFGETIGEILAEMETATALSA